MTGVENTIKDSLSQMVQKLSESPLAMSQNMSNMPTSQPTDTPIVRAKDENEVIDQLSSESLVALLSDCYWCELDTYAAYIWLKLSVNTKKEVLGLWEFMSEYVNYISQLEPTIQSYHKDPYYLTPLDFKNYNNNQIRELISKNKTLF